MDSHILPNSHGAQYSQVTSQSTLVTLAMGDTQTLVLHLANTKADSEAESRVIPSRLECVYFTTEGGSPIQ